MTRKAISVAAESLALGAAVCATLLLLAPWLQAGGRTFSTIEAIGSAGALDVIDGPIQIGVVAVWLVVPLSCGLAVLAAGLRRPALVRALVAVVGTAVFSLGLMTVIFARNALRWGAVAGTLAGLLALVFVVLALVTERTMGE